MPTTQQPCAVCKWDGYEVLFRSLLAGLLREGTTQRSEQMHMHTARTAQLMRGLRTRCAHLRG